MQEHDAGESWKLLPKTGPKDLHITGEKGKSIRCVAVDPTNGNIVYAASPAGKVFKSTDGGTTWNVAYEKKSEKPDNESVQIQFGKVNGDFHGGFWMPLAFPKGANPADCIGFGFSFQGGPVQPRDTIVTLTMTSGAMYRSKNISDIFKNDKWSDVLLKATDFVVDPEYVKKNADKLALIPAAPDWATVNRIDFVCVGSLPTQASPARIGKFFFVMKGADEGAAGKQVTGGDFATDKASRPMATSAWRRRPAASRPPKYRALPSRRKSRPSCWLPPPMRASS